LEELLNPSSNQNPTNKDQRALELTADEREENNDPPTEEEVRKAIL